ncbi:SDR family NAD(P)-dependent oxidoreductase [Jongsikchunia kroppenstedtii]|uniref:SDR family NAD(P)-dependent oxidoreductase n=1 Tax=Jongsikchunia kroppenstedtii TaxID=1121721 RepID=UPI00037517E3|nr:SDR family oxidoreductase [Jongsikchunia kroppenstedtii]
MPIPAPSASARAVITGASAGIGRQLATELARRGHSVLLIARREAELTELADDLHKRFGVTADVLAADLGDPESLANVVSTLQSTEVSVLCNNAGVGSFGDIVDLDHDFERQIVRVNAVATHELTLAVLPQMVKRGSGGILMVGSIAGNLPIPGNATYSATKGFVNNLAEALRVEVAEKGVNITLLAPGPVRTEGNTDMEGVPDFAWYPADKAARDSIDALERNKQRIVPGTFSKAISTAAAYAPRKISAFVAGKAFRGQVGPSE